MIKNKAVLVCCTILLIAIIATVSINFGDDTPTQPIEEVFLGTLPVEPFTSETMAILAADEADGKLTLAFSTTETFHTDVLAIDIVASNPNARIYYTTDGSAPTVNSRLFTGPVSFVIHTGVTRGVVLRAIAVYDNQVSEPLTKSFFVGREVDTRFDTLIFSVSTNPEYLFCHYNGIFVEGIIREEYIRNNPGHHIRPPSPANFNLRGREAERPVYIEVFSPDGERLFTQAAGLRTHGGWSRAQTHKSMRLIARREYSPDYGQFHFDFFPLEFAHDGTPIDRYDILILRNGGNDRYHGIFRHELGSILARNAGFTAVSPVRPVSVFLNGEYYGLKWLQVRFNEQYMQRLFNTPTRNFDILGISEWRFDTDDERILYDLRHKNSFSFKDLNDDDIFAEFESLVDIDNLLFYYAFQIFMGAEDWPHNNLRRWRYTGPELGLTPETDGRWRYIFFDLDWTLGLYGDDYTKPTFYRVLVMQDHRSPLLRNILTRQDMQERFTEIMHHISDNVVNEETVTETLHYLRSASRNEFTNAFYARMFPNWVTMDFIDYNHQNIINFARNRHRQIFADMEAFFNSINN